MIRKDSILNIPTLSPLTISSIHSSVLPAFNNPVSIRFDTSIPNSFLASIKSDTSQACFAVINHSLNKWECRSQIFLNDTNIKGTSPFDLYPGGQTNSFSDYGVLITNPTSDEEEEGDKKSKGGVGWVPYVAAFSVAGFLIGVGIVGVVIYRYRVRREEERAMMDGEEQLTTTTRGESMSYIVEEKQVK